MTEDQFEKLAQMIKQVHDDLADRVDGSATDTQEGFQKIAEQFAGVDSAFEQLKGKIDNEFSHVYTELRSIRTSIEALDKERVGHTKETDYILSRLAIIEKQLNITPA